MANRIFSRDHALDLTVAVKQESFIERHLVSLAIGAIVAALLLFLSSLVERM